MRALGFALLLVAVASCFASGCESILGVRDLNPIEEDASSDAAVDSQRLEDAASDTAAKTPKDASDEGLDAGADVSVGPDADAGTDANTHASDATDALVSDAPDDAGETPLPETVWWKLASEPDGYTSLSAVIVPGELPPERFVSFNFSFSFQPDVPPHPSEGNPWEAPYIGLRWGPAMQKTATLHVPKALTDAIELVDGPDVALPCYSSSPWILPCVDEFAAYGGYRFAEIAFEWVPNRSYRYSITRVEPSQALDTSSASWWEATITDLETKTELRLGRFQLKADRGGLQPISRSQVVTLANCDSPWPSIAAYAPRGESAGQARSASAFFQEPSCVSDGGDAADR